MPVKKVPESIKANYYLKYSDAQNYEDLIIKGDMLTTELNNLVSSNSFKLLELVQKLEEKNKIENVKSFKISWGHDVPLLTFKKQPKIKTGSWVVSDFQNYKFQGDNTQRTEKNYIESFNTIMNNITHEYKQEKTLNFFISNHLNIFYKCFKYRSDKRQSLETFKNDVKLMVKIIKLLLDNDKDELYIKYSVLLSGLSKIIDNSEKLNVVRTDKEIKTAIDYQTLLKLQEQMQLNFNRTNDNLPLTKRGNINVNFRVENMKLLLFSFYVLFPPLRREVFDLVIIKDEKDKEKYDNTIYIKDNNNIFMFLNTVKKQHQPITINLNDDVIKSYSGNLPARLIRLINESIQMFPRDYLFVNIKGAKASADVINDWNKSLLPDKQLNINSFRSAYISYYWPKLNRQQKDRLIFFMRSSSKYAETNYLKQFEQTISEEIQNKAINPDDNIISSKTTTSKAKNENEPVTITTIIKERAKRLSDEQRTSKRTAKNEYLKDYYVKNKEKLVDRAKQQSKVTYGDRLIREVNTNQRDISTIKKATIDRWGIKFNTTTNLYYI